MNSTLNKMVQNKRSKMLILTILLTLTILIKQSTSINLTYIVRKEGEKLQHNCIAEENERYAAVGWIYPLSSKKEDAPDIITKFIPSIQNEYNCEFGKNDKCNKFWSLLNWQIDENTTRTLDLTFDSRWEDFPVIFTGNGSKEFKDRIEIPSVFRAGFSVRASASVELLICQSWNPYDRPCYHLNISKTDIFLRKYLSLPKNVSNSDAFVDYYKASVNILSEDEWRNFVVSVDNEGILSLDDFNLNRTVIQHRDKHPLKPLYLLVRSIEPALWKIHQNHFLYTRTAQTSRLGPVLNLPSKSLCVSLYASTCKNCRMNFFIVKDTDSTQRKYLKAVGPTQEYEWQMIKLQDSQIQEDKLNIFVETEFVDLHSNVSEGFWAIDDVRLCHENEVKVTFMKLKKERSDDDQISCQVVQHPQWRPRKLVYSKIEDFPEIANIANITSISLNWTQEDPNNEINYFISYQANDLCLSEPFNLRRIKSNGFVRTKHNEITIENLIPYTKYNITFTTMLHDKDNQLFVTTLESKVPTPEELPSGLQIRPSDSQVFVSWNKVDCQSIYGHLIYSIQVTNTETNRSKEIQAQTGNTIEISGLEPFTLYTFTITTARSFENIEMNKYVIPMSLNFTTLPGMAPPVENLEVYSADETSVSLRYDLPKRAKGRPVAIQVMRCNAISFYKCKPAVLKITRCKLWPKKYCAEVENLMPNQTYNLRVSIKNEDTNIDGKEAKVEAVTRNRIPGPPTNITYKMVNCQDALDYCHLNITWLHPYNQNGTITSFHIVLNGTDDNITKDIQEIMKISNKTYSFKYEYQIKVIPYGTHYELYVQSVNSKHKSNFAHIHLKTDDLGKHIDQNPVLEKLTYNSATFKLPHVDPRLKSYNLIIAVQDFDRKKDLSRDSLKVKKVWPHICHKFGNTWILPQVEITNSTDIKEFTIGSEEASNKYLNGDTQYCITFIMTNKYKGSEHDVVYLRKLKTPPDPAAGSYDATEAPESSGSGQYNHLYGLLALLLLIPIGVLAYWYFKKRRPKPKQRENGENVYESLPFEECEENCVNNETYDHLLHK